MAKEEIKAKYDIEFQKLGSRAKNFLRDLDLDKFNIFYQDIILGGSLIDFRSLRNCGVKTETELKHFIEKFPPEKRSTEAFIFRESYSTSEKLHQEITSNWFLQQIFSQLIAKQNPEIKKLLKKYDAESLQGFSHHFLKSPVDLPKHFSLLIPPYLFGDIQLFREKILDYHEKTKQLASLGNLFSMISFLLIDNKPFRDIEWDLFKQYYRFIKGYKFATLQEIADKNKLTKKRIRQISHKLLKDIDSIINNLKNNIRPDFSQYIFGEAFAITKETETSINQQEKTNFSRMFITYVLSSLLIKYTDYYYLNTSKQKNQIAGLFIHKDLKFSFEAFYQDIEKITRKPRKKFYRIPVSYIFNKYTLIESENYEIKSDYEEKLLEAILILLSSIPRKIEYKIQNKYIMIRRN